MTTRKVNIPMWLWNLHGKTAYALDIVLVYTFAMAATAACIWLSAELSFWQQCLLAVLAFDIAGGAISNFTEGTKAYYASKPGSAHTFIWAHSLHACILALVFYNLWHVTLTASLLILLLASSVRSIRVPPVQRTAGWFCFAAVLLVVVSWGMTPPVLTILLLLFALKLIAGYAIQ